MLFLTKPYNNGTFRYELLTCILSRQSFDKSLLIQSFAMTYEMQLDAKMASDYGMECLYCEVTFRIIFIVIEIQMAVLPVSYGFI